MIKFKIQFFNKTKIKKRITIGPRSIIFTDHDSLLKKIFCDECALLYQNEQRKPNKS